MFTSADTALTPYQFSAAELMRGIRASMALSTSEATLHGYGASIETPINTHTHAERQKYL